MDPAPLSGNLFVLLTDDRKLERRVHGEALQNYFSAFARTIFDVLGELDGAGADFDLEASCVLSPDEETLIHVETNPESIPVAETTLALLKSRLGDLARPPISEGPVAFVCRTEFGAGAEARRQSVSFPFHHVLDQQDAIPSAPEEDAANEVLDLSSFRLEQLHAFVQQNPENPRGYQFRAELQKQQGNYADAVEDYSRWIDLDPDHGDGFIRRGEAYCLSGSFSEGLRDFTEAIRLGPKDAAAYHARGMVYLDLEAWDASAADFETAHSRDPRRGSICVNLAKAKFSAGQMAPALAAVEKAIHLDPHLEDAYLLRAVIRWQSCAGQTLPRFPTSSDEQTGPAEQTNPAAQTGADLVLADVNQAIRIDPLNPRHQVFRAEVRLFQEDYAGAISDCELALALDEELAEAYGVRGIAHQMEGRFREAVADCTQAVNRGMQSAAIYFSRATACEFLEHYESALEDCEAAVALDPRHAAAINLRGQILLRQNAVAEAIDDFESAIELAPDWAIPYANRANALRIQGRQQSAIEDYSRALQKEPSFAPAYFNRALTRLEDEDSSQPRSETLHQAMHDFDEGLRLLPDFGPGYFGRAMAHLELHNYESALADLNRVIELDDQCAPAFFHRANVLAQQNDLQGALRDFGALIHLCPTLGAAYSGRGNVWIQQGEFEKALADYREAIQCDPELAEHYTVQRLVVEAANEHRQERFEQAIEKANEALALDEESAPAIAVRAASYWYSELLVEAAEDYTFLLNMDEKSFAALSGRGQVYAEMGEFQAALDDLNRAIEIGAETETGANMAYAYSGRALAHAGLQQYEQASWDFDRSIADCPENAWVHYNHALMHHQLGDCDKSAICFELALELDDPRLTPRKRDRARSYVANHKKT